MRGYPLPVLALLAIAFVVGCQNQVATQPTQTAFARAPQPPESPPPPYTLEPGDQLDVKLFYHPELNETAQIQPDGRIMLQLVGAVQARGTTPEELAKDLTHRYVQAGLRDPVVTVILRKSTSQKVFVGGEVNTPKMIPYEGRLTLTQALFEAGGMKPTAEPESIVVLRNDGKGGALALKINFDEEVVEAAKDMALQPYDVVIVPKSSIGKANQFVELYLSKMMPTWLSFGFSYLLGAAAVIP